MFSQIRELQLSTSQPFGFTLNYMVQAITSLGVALYFSWKMALVVLASLPLTALVLAIISRSLSCYVTGQAAAMSKAIHVANVAFTNIFSVKCFDTKDQERRKYTTMIRSAAKLYYQQARVNAMQIGFVRFATTTMFVQGFWYGGYLVNTGSANAGDVITTFWSCLMTTKALEDILPHILVLEKGKAAGAGLRSILDSVDRGDYVPGRFEGGSFPEFCDGDVEVLNVRFAYPSRPDHPVLSDTTFFFPAGETTFVVGVSGSGKSSLACLLMRFYRPQFGTIFLDGDRFEELNLNWLRNNITLVQQQSILFDETILQNIAFGSRDHKHITAEHIQPCIALAELGTIISSLPQGLDTRVGSGGSGLSGGQRQRIAIARARLRDAPVLILDESTSALDNRSRMSITSNIREWRKDKTTIVITHDLTQIGNDDFMYVVEDGKIVKEGYRREVVPNIKTAQSGPNQETGPSSHVAKFDFGLDPYAPLELTAQSVLPQLSKSETLLKRESIDIQLEAISTERLSSHGPPRPRNKIHHGMLRRQKARIFNLATRRLSQNEGIDQEDLLLEGLWEKEPPVFPLSGALSLRTGRPMTVHQTMALRTLAREAVRPDQDFPPLTISETPDLDKRMSLETSRGRIVLDSPALTILEILSTVWPNTDRLHRALLVAALIAAIVHASCPPAFSFILVQLFQTFYIKENHTEKALAYSMAILAVAIVDGLASFTLHYFLERAGQQWVDELRVKAVQRILEQDAAYFDKARNSPHALISALDRDAEEMRNLVGRFAGLIVVVATMMTIAIVWAMAICWKMTLVGLAASPVLYSVTKGFDKVSAQAEAQANCVAQEVGAVFVESFSDIRTVRAYALESHFHSKYTLATSKALTVGFRRAIYSGIWFGLSGSAINYVTALVFWFGAHLAKTNAYPVKSILQALSLLLFSTANANAVIAYIPQITSSVDTADRLLRLTRLPLTAQKHPQNLRLDPHHVSTLSGPIQFTDVTLYYPARPEVAALCRLDLTIPANQVTAIVGASGSGKSSITQLILGMYPPTAHGMTSANHDNFAGPPSLTICGHDIRSLHLPTLRSMISIVPQTPVIFPGTVRENLIYGLDLSSDLTTQTNIEEGARQAGIHDFILSLPSGYDTVISDSGGKSSNNDNDENDTSRAQTAALGVSGGQAQRIVIARALIRKPRILILDEATSALDDGNAQLIRDTIQELVEENRNRSRTNNTGRHNHQNGVFTVIIVTHAREMMEWADKVVVLDRGSVVEEGGFDDLLRRKGWLYRMLETDGVEEPDKSHAYKDRYRPNPHAQEETSTSAVIANAFSNPDLGGTRQKTRSVTGTRRTREV